MVEYLKAVINRETLSQKTAESVMNLILQGSVPPEQIAAFLIALQCKGEAVDEIVGFVNAVRAQARIVPCQNEHLVDTCGTGGDGSGTFNVSTTVAFVVAACGQPVAKHGNRAVSSRSGSFDVLEKLGLLIASSPIDVQRSIDQFGIGFMFAPSFHPALKNLAALRRTLGVRTVFNLLGPLLNPAGVKRQLIGVYSSDLVEKVALALRELGSLEAMVVRGEDGLDEISISAPTRVAHLKNGEVYTFIITPEEFNLRRSRPEEVLGGDAETNARILVDILSGQKGAPRDLVVLNAAAALVIGGRAGNFKDAILVATDAIDCGKALKLLNRMRRSPLKETGT